MYVFFTNSSLRFLTSSVVSQGAAFQTSSPRSTGTIAVCIADSFIPSEKRGGGGGSRDIGGELALISGFWGDLRKRGE